MVSFFWSLLPYRRARVYYNTLFNEFMILKHLNDILASLIKVYNWIFFIGSLFFLLLRQQTKFNVNVSLIVDVVGFSLSSDLIHVFIFLTFFIQLSILLCKIKLLLFFFLIIRYITKIKAHAFITICFIFLY
jgi:hypothetical protein